MVKRPTDEEMAKVSHAVREVFGLQLVGIDVIVDNETGKYGIIDVNAFPGTGVRQHLSLYLSHVDILKHHEISATFNITVSLFFFEQNQTFIIRKLRYYIIIVKVETLYSITNV